MVRSPGLFVCGTGRGIKSGEAAAAAAGIARSCYLDKGIPRPCASFRDKGRKYRYKLHQLTS